MERTRGTWMAVIFCGQITIILLLQTVMQVSSVFLKLKCTGATDGTSPDEPCMLKAYLGSEVTLECAKHSYTKREPDYLVPFVGHVCKDKLKAEPAKCDAAAKMTYNSLGLADVLFDSETLVVPFQRNLLHKAPFKVYGRCAKNESEALYWGIEFIPRPKFPDEGRIISCVKPWTAPGAACILTAHLSDVVVVDCPGKDGKLVPPQANDRAHTCNAALKAADSTCSDAKDLAGEGVTLTTLKSGAVLSAAAFKSPKTKTGKVDKVEGFLNCQASSQTNFYSISLEFKAGKYTMAKTYKLCDISHGEKQGTPCTVTLKPGESVVINCSLLGLYVPNNLTAPGGAYCTRPAAADPLDRCADDTAQWAEIGAEVFMNADNIVVTHAKKDLAKATTAYGKCSEGSDANYFKLIFTEATSSDDEKPKENYAAGASTKVAVFFGVLGTAFLATETANKVF